MRSGLFEEQTLGPFAIDHIRRALSNGKQLSRRLLALPLETGRVTVHLPAKIDNDHVADFERGGLAFYGASITAPRENTGMQPVMIGDLAEILPRFYRTVGEYLSQSAHNCVILEDFNAAANDRWLATYEGRYFTHRDEVYHLLRPEDSDEASIRRMTAGFPTYPYVCILTALDGPEIPNPWEISDSLLNEAAMNTDRLLVGAYDGENYLTWSGNASS